MVVWRLSLYPQNPSDRIRLDTANLGFFLSIMFSPYVLMVYESRVIGSVWVFDVGAFRRSSAEDGSTAGFSKALSTSTEPRL